MFHNNPEHKHLADETKPVPYALEIESQVDLEAPPYLLTEDDQQPYTLREQLEICAKSTLLGGLHYGLVFGFIGFLIGMGVGAAVGQSKCPDSSNFYPDDDDINHCREGFVHKGMLYGSVISAGIGFVRGTALGIYKGCTLPPKKIFRPEHPQEEKTRLTR